MHSLIPHKNTFIFVAAVLRQTCPLTWCRWGLASRAHALHLTLGYQVYMCGCRFMLRLMCTSSSTLRVMHPIWTPCDASSKRRVKRSQSKFGVQVGPGKSRTRAIPNAGIARPYMWRAFHVEADVRPLYLEAVVHISFKMKRPPHIYT